MEPVSQEHPPIDGLEVSGGIDFKRLANDAKHLGNERVQRLQSGDRIDGLLQCVTRTFQLG